MAGQINIGTEFGNAIYKIAQNPQYTSFCEVGTWNGRGSTQCIYEGIRNRDAVLYSIEGDKNMYAQAINVWKGVPNVNLYYGTLHRTIMSRDHIQKHPFFPRVADHYRIHYDTEYTVSQNAPLVVVPKCDVILLDGGEFSTQGDWETLYHPDLKVVILDDTLTMKTHDIREQLLVDTNWKATYDSRSNRNGCCIFERV
jgi:hypothetical protein